MNWIEEFDKEFLVLIFGNLLQPSDQRKHKMLIDFIQKQIDSAYERGKKEEVDTRFNEKCLKCGEIRDTDNGTWVCNNCLKEHVYRQALNQPNG